MSALRILAISTLYPNKAQPRHGIFLEHRLASLSRLDGVELRVLAPVPWFPSGHNCFGRYSAFARAPTDDVRRGIRIAHPRYVVIPKVGMVIAPFLLAAALIRSASQIRKSGFDFDVIDAYYLYPDGVAATILGALLNVPVLLTAFGNDVSLIPQHTLPRAMIRWAARNASGITAVCTALKNAVTQIGVAPDRVRVILHGVDLDMFHPPLDRVGDRQKLGLDCLTIVSVGHLIRRKRHDLAIEAIEMLPGVKLLVVGDGPEEKSLRKLVHVRGLQERVTFLGHVDQAWLPTVLGAADLLLNCSEREGIANVLLEALACGTPVAATAVWGSPEVVTAAEAGVLVWEGTPSAIAEGVRNLLRAPPDRAATRRFAERFSWHDTARNHLRAIEDVVVGRTPLQRRKSPAT